MSMYPTDDEEWDLIHPYDLWAYNKLQVSRILGYQCGPSGTTVPNSDFYIVRPCMNIRGMGLNAKIMWLDGPTKDLHPAEFWCEVFSGEHLSVDFYKKECNLVVKGTRDTKNPLYKWDKWEKIDKKVEFPPILNNLVGNYDWIQCEFIDGNLIEVHFRRNPNFQYGNSVAIPIWEDSTQENHQNLRYVEEPNYLRKGFLVDN